MSTDFNTLILTDRAQIEHSARDLAQIAAPLPATHGAEGSTSSFADSLKDAVQGVDQQEKLAATRMADVDSGRSDDLVGAMLASQEASLSFSMLMQVRNKVMGAMDELIKLPV
ncbi:MAG: flagellar hook-basal body complex protein FliE [Acidobacteriota bacterium]